MDERRIGDILLAQGLVTERDRAEAQAYQGEVGGLFGQALMRLGALSEPDLLATLAAQLDLPILDPSDAPSADAARDGAEILSLKTDWLTAREAIVWQQKEGRLACAARHPLDPLLTDTLEHRNPGPWTYFLAPNALLDALLGGLSAQGGTELGDEDIDDPMRLRELAEEAPVIDFVNGLFSQALSDRASDIHIEPSEHVFQVRSRIDGVLHVKTTQPRRKFDAVASRIKLLSAMDIAERRLPQDGRQTIRFAGEEIDLRVSSLPTSWGESLVLRLLRKQRTLLDLQALGLTGHARRQLDRLLKENNGIILVTGPTGSGKSTTLYRSLEIVNDGVRKIITIEDPVEYDMEGISQIQVKSEIGYDFARGLRAILRQDPDVIMVGEIRDGETAAIAAQAALTGHLVFSTLHTNSALAAIPRLVDLGLEPYLVAAALRGTAAQRLVRRLCDQCAEPAGKEQAAAYEAQMRTMLAAEPTSDHGTGQWREPVGCPACSGTGYTGRLALFEIVELDLSIQEAISAGANLRELERLARAQGFVSLLEDGALKARAGLTSLKEVQRVVGAAPVPELEVSGL